MKKEEFELKVKQGILRKVGESIQTDYYVNEDGIVYSIHRKNNTIRELKQNLVSGYPVVGINKKMVRVHRLVALAFIPNPENKPYINHIDGVKNHNQKSNLEWVTPSENSIHAIETGLYKEDFMEIVSKLGKDKRLLTFEEAKEIRKLYANRKVEKITQKELAKKYSVSQKVIYCIIHNQTYREA